MTQRLVIFLPAPVTAPSPGFHWDLWGHATAIICFLETQRSRPSPSKLTSDVSGRVTKFGDQVGNASFVLQLKISVDRDRAFQINNYSAAERRSSCVIVYCKPYTIGSALSNSESQDVDCEARFS
eukprot:s2534_g12.t1